MDGFHFLGVYSGTPPKGNTYALEEPPLWNVYLKKNHEIYLIQKLDENNQVTQEQYKVSPTYFGINFRQINNVPVKQAIKKQVNLLAQDKDTHESFFTSFFKNNSAFNSIFQNQNTNTPKRSGEFNLTLGANNPISDKKKEAGSNQSIPSLSSDIKKSKEFDFNLIKDASTEKTKETSQTNTKTTNTPKLPPQKNIEFQLNMVKNSSNNNNTQKYPNTQKYSQNNHETDQHPFDEKYIPERFGLDSILSSLDDPKKQAKKDTELVNAKMGYNPISKDIHPHTKLSSQAIKEKQPNIIENKISSSKEVENNSVVTVESTSLEIDNKTALVTISGENEEKNSSKHLINKTEKNSESEIISQIQPNGDEGLLPAKGTKSLSFSEKALRLDNTLRKEFRVSLNHWNMSKKNMAMRQFHAIINKEGNFVPAHKHMFTDFAIQLRKINQHDLALVAAIRCTKLSPDDSHAFFNVSRLYYELGRYEKANEYIDKALNLEADLSPALRLSSIIKECLRRKAATR